MAINEAVNIEVDVKGTTTVQQAASAYEDLGDAVSKTQLEAERLAQQYGITDKRTQEAIRTAAKYKEQMEQLDFAIEGARGGSARLTGAVQGIVAGFEAASAAAILLGVESEDLEKVLVRLTATMALAQAIRDLDEYKQSLKDLTQFINTNAIKAFRELSIAAQGLIIAGIVTVLYAIYDALEEVNTETLRTIKIRESLTNINNGLIDSFDEEKKAIGGLQEVAEDENQTKENRLRAIRQIQEQYPSYLQNLKQDKLDTDAIKTANENLNAELLKRAKTEAALEELGKISAEELKAQLDYNQALQDQEDLRLSGQQLTPQEIRSQETLIKQRLQLAKVNLDATQAQKDAILDFINTNDLVIENNNKTSETLKKTGEENVESIKKMGGATLQATITEPLTAAVFEPLKLAETQTLSTLERLRNNWQKYGGDIKDSIGNALIASSQLLEAFAGEDEARQKKAFEYNKKIKIALTTIATAEGTVNAFKSAQDSPITPFFPAYPFVQAAAALSFGLAQIAQIQNQQFQSPMTPSMEGQPGGGAFGTNLNAPAVRLPRTEEFTGDRRIFVTEYDISNTQERVKVTEDVSTVK